MRHIFDLLLKSLNIYKSVLCYTDEKIKSVTQYHPSVTIYIIFLNPLLYFYYKKQGLLEMVLGFLEVNRKISQDNP